MRTATTWLLVSLLVLLGRNAAAQDTCTWTGPDGDWETAEHWSCGHVPTPADTAVISASRAITLNSDIELAGFDLPGTSSALLGAGNLTITSRMTWGGGDYIGTATLGGTGTLTIQNGATLAITSEGDKRLDRTLENYGATVWTGGSIIGYHTTFRDGAPSLQEVTGRFINRSGATFIVAIAGGGGGWHFEADFQNEAGALFEFDTGESAAFGRQPEGFQHLPPDDPSFTLFANDGVVNVRRGRMIIRGNGANTGLISLTDGAELISSGRHFVLGGRIEGSGLVDLLSDGYRDVLNTATWRPGPGVGLLSVSKQFILDREGRIEIEIGGTAPGEYDQMVFSDTYWPEDAVFNGILDVSMLPGFVPQPGDRFPIFSVPASANTLFRQLNGLVDVDNDLVLWPSFESRTVVLTAEAGIPTMAPEITLSTESIAQRENPLILFANGEGFAPDVTARLVCRACNDPINFGEVDGPFRILSPTQAGVWFDFSDPRFRGEYDLVIEDPRGGRASAPFTIYPPLTVSVTAPNPQVQEGEAANFVLRRNTRFEDQLEVEFELDGRASYFSDYLLDRIERVVRFAPGEQEAHVRVLALSDNLTEGADTLVLTLDESSRYGIAGSAQVELAIMDGPPADALTVLTMTPQRGGSGGSVMIRVAGQGIAAGAVARLVQGGNEIAGRLPGVNENGTVLSTIFDLAGQAEGTWDLVVDNGDGETAVLPDAFAIEPPQEVQLEMQLTGPRHFRSTGPLQPHVATVINRGNEDAYLVPVWIRVSKLKGGGERADHVAALDLSFEVQAMEGWEDAPVVVNAEDEIIASVILPVVPAGSAVSLPFRARAYNVSAWTTRPLVEGLPDTEAVGKLARSLTARAVSTPMAECITAVIQTVISLIPAADCVQAIAKLVHDVTANSMSGGSSVLSGDGTGLALSGAGTLAALIGAGVSCGKLAIPFAQIMDIAVNLALGGANIVRACDLWPDDPADPKPERPRIRNPFERPDPEEIEADEIWAWDPNDKLGPNGLGEGHFVAGTDPFGYLIRFENKAEATAAALEVLVTDRLDTTTFDLSTFSLGAISFGDRTVVPPPGLKTYTTSVDLEEQKLRVLIFASLDEGTGEALWRFATVDLETGELPLDPFAGFLPPNMNPPEGEGSVFFTVEPKADLGTGEEIRNEARIIFDTNEPIDTPVWINTVDHDPPSSRVLPLAESQGDSSFVVRWTGTDPGAGIRNYSVYVSHDGGPYSLWLAHTSDTSATFSADSSKSLAFYSIARDAVGHYEEAPANPDAVTGVTVSTETPDDLPKVFALRQNYPNPFNPQTTIHYDVPKPAHVRLAVYDLLGRRVSVLVDEDKPAGRYSVVWNPQGLASGVYFYRMRSDGFDRTEKMLLLK